MPVWAFRFSSSWCSTTRTGITRRSSSLRPTVSTATSTTRTRNLRALFNAVNPDLSAFKARGGKLIHYHGWSDPDITPLNSINYYESVVKAQGGDVHGLQNTRGVLPALHGAWDVALPGRTGSNEFRHDRTTGQVGGQGRRAGQSDRFACNERASWTGPGRCAHTRRKRNGTGTGSTDDAANFVCALPKQ